MEHLAIPLNLEMAATKEMLEIALRHRPHAACIVPQKREERTTAGGLDAVGQHNHLAPFVARLAEANTRVSLFVEPDPRQVEARSEEHTSELQSLMLISSAVICLQKQLPNDQ